MSVVAKLSSQVLGLSSASAELGPYTLMTTVSNAPGAQHLWLAISPSFLAQLAVGSAVNVYIAFNSADIAAIEGAVSVVQIDGTT